MSGAAAMAPEKVATEIAHALFQEACAKAQAAAAGGRFDRAGAYLNLASIHFAELTRLRNAVESMAKEGAR